MTHAEFEFTRLRMLAEAVTDQMQVAPRDTAVILVLEAFMEVRRRAKDELVEAINKSLDERKQVLLQLAKE